MTKRRRRKAGTAEARSASQQLLLPLCAGPYDELAVLNGVIGARRIRARDLAKRTGISDARVSNIRRGVGAPATAEEKLLLADALGVPIRELFLEARQRDGEERSV